MLLLGNGGKTVQILWNDIDISAMPQHTRRDPAMSSNTRGAQWSPGGAQAETSTMESRRGEKKRGGEVKERSEDTRAEAREAKG